MFALLISVAVSPKALAENVMLDYSSNVSSALGNKNKIVYDMDVKYKSDTYVIAYLGNTLEDNAKHKEDYDITVKNSVGEVVSKSSNVVSKRGSDDVNYQLVSYVFKKGAYKVEVSLKDGKSLEKDQALELYTDSEILEGIKGLSIDGEKVAKSTKKEVKFTAKADTANLEYSFFVNGKEQQKSSDKNTFVMSAKEDGTYTVKVVAVDKKYKEIKAEETIKFMYNEDKTVEKVTDTVTNVEVVKPLEIKSFTISKKTPQPKQTKITLNAKASGDTVKFKYNVYDVKAKKWSTVKNYSSSSVAKWTPKKSGDYKVRLYVKDKKGKVVTKTYKYKVYTPSKVTVTSFKADKNVTKGIKKGTKVKFTAKAKGTHLIYQYRVYDKKTKVWKTVQDYSSKKTFTWKTDKKGTYDVVVNVKQNGAKTNVYKKVYNVKVK